MSRQCPRNGRDFFLALFPRTAATSREPASNPIDRPEAIKVVRGQEWLAADRNRFNSGFFKATLENGQFAAFSSLRGRLSRRIRRLS
jgi:hypothetical protein